MPEFTGERLIPGEVDIPGRCGVRLPADPLEAAAQHFSRPGELLLACAGREAYTTRGAVHA